jgi:hypothetical protein
MYESMTGARGDNSMPVSSLVPRLLKLAWQLAGNEERVVRIAADLGLAI